MIHFARRPNPIWTLVLAGYKKLLWSYCANISHLPFYNFFICKMISRNTTPHIMSTNYGNIISVTFNYLIRKMKLYNNTKSHLPHRCLHRHAHTLPFRTILNVSGVIPVSLLWVLFLLSFSWTGVILALQELFSWCNGRISVKEHDAMQESIYSGAWWLLNQPEHLLPSL